MAQLVMGAVGAVAGFFISGGNPYGALIGFNIGASLGAESMTVEGNKIGDIAAQTSKEGVARPIVWGRVRPIGGNLIATSAPDIVKTKHKSGGKGGGGSTTTTTESVYRTYAIRVCEGPITGFVRIWRNNELVYDARGNDWGDENNPAFLGVATLYLGGWDQMPDPSLEGVFGSGNVPPHRGTAYMVMNHELLDDTGGAVPQWIFEVERSDGILLTSKIYPIESLSHLESSGVSSVKEKPSPYFIENTNSSGLSISYVTFKDVLLDLGSTIVDKSTSNGLTIDSGLLYNDEIIPVTLTSEINKLSSSGLSILNGSLADKLITHSNYSDKASSGGLSITSGSLS